MLFRSSVNNKSYFSDLRNLTRNSPRGFKQKDAFSYGFGHGSYSKTATKNPVNTQHPSNKKKDHILENWLNGDGNFDKSGIFSEKNSNRKNSKTTQIIYEYDKSTGRKKAKLKAPRGLYAVYDNSSIEEPEQAIRFPNTYAIVRGELAEFYPKKSKSKKKNKEHKEKEKEKEKEAGKPQQQTEAKIGDPKIFPNVIEPFYIQTGQERKPRIGQSGRCVYHCQNGDEYHYHKSSQGGKNEEKDKVYNRAEVSNQKSESFSKSKNLTNNTSSSPFITKNLKFEARFEGGNLNKAIRTGEFEYELILIYYFFGGEQLIVGLVL